MRKKFILYIFHFYPKTEDVYQPVKNEHLGKIKAPFLFFLSEGDFKTLSENGT